MKKRIKTDTTFKIVEFFVFLYAFFSEMVNY